METFRNAGLNYGVFLKFNSADQKEFPVTFDAAAKRVYVDRMIDTSHAGLSKVIEATEQSFNRIFKPVMTEYRDFLQNGADRSEALKMFDGIKTIHFTEAEANSSLKNQK